MIDTFWCDGKKIIEIEPTICPCCTKCWMITKGKSKGKCVYGGPYLGHIDVEEDGKRKSNSIGSSRFGGS